MSIKKKNSTFITLFSLILLQISQIFSNYETNLHIKANYANVVNVEICDLLEKHDLTGSIRPIISPEKSHKLFVTSNDSYSLHNRLFKDCKTQTGKIIGMKLLLTPLSSEYIKDIENRQKLIKYLQENSIERQNIEKILDNLKQEELYYWNILKELPKNLKKELKYISLPKTFSEYNQHPYLVGTHLNAWKLLKSCSNYSGMIGVQTFENLKESVNPTSLFFQKSIWGCFKSSVSACISSTADIYRSLLSPSLLNKTI